ncbi:MAG: acyltransferase family protein [Terriglobia bacterium]
MKTTEIETERRVPAIAMVPSSPPRAERLVSLDALRGFDMFWITGGTAILFGLGKVIHRPFFDKFLEQFDHVPWQGLHFFDLIWPLFMFIMGAAIPLGVARRRARGQSDRTLLLHAVWRAVVMFCLGTVTQGNLLLFDWYRFRPCYSVLHGLAAGYLVATIVTLKVKPKWHAATIAGLLLAYWAIVMLIPVPGVGAGNLTPNYNLPTYVDQLILGHLHYGWNTWFLSYLGFGASVLLGVLAGQMLMSDSPQMTKVYRLLIAGALSLVGGLVWSFSFPIIKLMWTSSYVMISGGVSFMALALFYWIIDVLGYRKWAFGFIVIGMNSIAVYVATEIFDFRQVGNIFVGHLLPHIGRWADFVEASAAFAVVWLILYWMYRNKEFIRI